MGSVLFIFFAGFFCGEMDEIWDEVMDNINRPSRPRHLGEIDANIC